MLDSLLPTKLFVPATRPELVNRSRLIDQLTDGLHRTLTLISAPAGFGKTTLAAEWVKSLDGEPNHNAETNVAWLSLDESDNDVKHFLTYFFSAITQFEVVNENLQKTITEILQSPNLPPIEPIFSPVMIELSSAREKLVFVLDDYHLIEDQQIHNAVNFWLENVPPQVHTVVITREDPPFPLVRLRARSHMTELRSADLRFTKSESTQFLNDIMGLKLDAGAITLLEERTEGWVVGLQMAALSMKNRKDIVGFIESFSGTNRYILDYLLEEVLANQPTEIQEFLLLSSILKRLSAPLCDALFEKESGSASILENLEQANLFLIPLDDERNWYRYHHLFGDLLKARLQQTNSGQQLAELHRRAARWYEKNNLAYGAIYHASLIPDDEWVERIIDQNYMEIFQRRDSSSIRNWTGELGEELIYKRPQLAIHEANSRAWFGQLEEADHLLYEAEKRLQLETPTSETGAMFGYLAYVRSRITAMRGDFERAIQLCLDAMENTPASNQGLLGGIGVMLGYGYFLNGDFLNADQTLRETIDTGKRSGAINTTIGAYCVLARLYALQGQLHKSFDVYQEAKRFIQNSEGQHRGAMSIVDVGLAEILYEWNDLDAALTHIEGGLEFIPLWSKADDIALAYITFSQIQLAQSSISDAEKNIRKSVQIIQSNGIFSEARDAANCADIQLRLKKEDSHPLSRWASSLEERASSDNPFRFENEGVLITLARVMMSQKKYDKADELLIQLEASAKAGGRTGRLIQILLLQAVLVDMQGDKAQAFSILEEALSMAEPEGYARTFLDEGQQMQVLLVQWLAEAGSSSVRDYGNYLASLYDGDPFLTAAQPEDIGPGGELVEPLSAREVEVLNLIALGRTNKEISVELVISPGTVKAHTSSIYRKLDAANRTEAVARARRLRLLP